jgi:acyl-coenzyme A thioesterase PaaI-like protein
MVSAKLTSSLIIDQIRNSKTSFDLSTSEMIRLSQAGVPEEVIAAMRKASNGSSAKATGNTVKLADGEKIRLVLAEDLSSATANIGDRINFNVAEDLKVGDSVVIGKGASAVGSITEAKKKGMLGRGGKLNMQMEFVKAVDDQNVRIRATVSREGDDKTGKTVAVFVLAGPFALLVKGKDIVVHAGAEYPAYVDENKDIIASTNTDYNPAGGQAPPVAAPAVATDSAAPPAAPASTDTPPSPPAPVTTDTAPSPPGPVTISLGQTIAEVEAINGKPDKIIDLGAKKIYVYKDLKITFTDGKVSDVQ